MGLKKFKFGSIINKINYSSAEKPMVCLIQRRGQNLGTWTGTSYEYSELVKNFSKTDLQITKKL